MTAAGVKMDWTDPLQRCWDAANRAGQMVLPLLGQDRKPGKPSCSPYRRTRLTRSAAVKERRPLSNRSSEHGCP